MHAITFMAPPHSPFTLLGGRHQTTELAIGYKYTVEAGEVDSWLWHQGGQSCNEIQWLKDHRGGVVPVRRLQDVVLSTFLGLLRRDQ